MERTVDRPGADRGDPLGVVDGRGRCRWKQITDLRDLDVDPIGDEERHGLDGGMVGQLGDELTRGVEGHHEREIRRDDALGAAGDHGLEDDRVALTDAHGELGGCGFTHDIDLVAHEEREPLCDACHEDRCLPEAVGERWCEEAEVLARNGGLRVGTAGDQRDRSGGETTQEE